MPKSDICRAQSLWWLGSEEGKQVTVTTKSRKLAKKCRSNVYYQHTTKLCFYDFYLQTFHRPQSTFPFTFILTLICMYSFLISHTHIHVQASHTLSTYIHIRTCANKQSFSSTFRFKCSHIHVQHVYIHNQVNIDDHQQQYVNWFCHRHSSALVCKLTLVQTFATFIVTHTQTLKRIQYPPHSQV